MRVKQEQLCGVQLALRALSCDLVCVRCASELRLKLVIIVMASGKAVVLIGAHAQLKVAHVRVIIVARVRK